MRQLLIPRSSNKDTFLKILPFQFGMLGSGNLSIDKEPAGDNALICAHEISK